MSPEQVARDPTDRRGDVFAVGLMLREAIAGGSAWGELSENEVLLRLLTGKPPVVGPGEAPEPLREICNQAVAAQPDQRFATALEFQRALGRYLNGLSQPPSEDGLRAFMEAHFSESRADRNRLINDRVRRVSEQPGPGEALSLETSGQRVATVPAVPRRMQPMPPADKPRRKAKLALGVAVVGTLIGGVLAVTRWPSAANTSPGSDDSTDAKTLLTCLAGFKFCDKTCVSVDRPEFGCGLKHCQPCRVQNATPRCNVDHQCDIAVCYQDFDDCDHDPSNGCETPVRLDPDHCGGCGQACPPLPHAVRGCGDGCTIWRCQPGYRDCNEDTTDGCEVDVSGDVDHCGHCAIHCGPGQRCQEGKCRG